MKKILGIISILFTMIFTVKVNALKTNSIVLPDLPNNEKNFVIFKTNNMNTSADILTYAAVIPDDFKVQITRTDDYDFDVIGLNDNTTYKLIKDKTTNEYKWSDASVSDSKDCREIIATSVDIYNASDEIIYESGHGLPLPSLFTKVKSVISSFLTAFGTVATSLMGNAIFQIMFGIVILFLCIGLVYGAVRKVRNKGR